MKQQNLKYYHNNIIRELAIESFTGLLILLWMYVGVDKLINFSRFVSAMGKQPLPEFMKDILPIMLPIAELATAILLVLRKSNTIGLLVSFILMSSFSLYVGFALSGAFGEIPCSCGGIFSFMNWKGHLIFNIIFTFLAFAGWRWKAQIRRSA